MPDRFADVPDQHRILRLAIPEGSFLPRGATRPLAAWLAPTDQDRAEGLRNGRPAGLSAWDDAWTTVAQARALSGRSTAEAFRVLARDVRAVGRRHAVDVAVVHDPADDLAPERGWEGHALIEGLERPLGGDRHAFNDLREALLERFEAA
jgi:hypothetical protein